MLAKGGVSEEIKVRA